MPATDDPYSSIHYVQSLPYASEEDLCRLIQTFPVIDNHAHNVLREENACGHTDYPFQSVTSEAQGHALLDHAHTSLPNIRGITQLAELFSCSETLEDVAAARYEWVNRDYPSLVRKCFEGTHTILMDDGLSPDDVYPVEWHGQFVPSVARIVRIEAIAAEILENLVPAAGFIRHGSNTEWGRDQSESFLIRFNTMFRNQIRTLSQSPNVRGFKSVVCYRSGLDVSLESRNVFRPHQSLTESPLLTAFHEFLKQAVKSHSYRVAQKQVNDFLVLATCDVLDKLVDTEGESLPFQFHTGLGDTDIDLVKANPAYMKPLIAAFPNVDFVLLHSSYPYTREAGYLAAQYANAWLDLGLVFPMLSKDGQISVLRQALELTPVSKILWSTDGHMYAETYWLANKQFRQVLERVLMAYVTAGEVTIAQAINIAVDIMFWNSNSLYKLDEERKFPQLLQACGRSSNTSIRTLVGGASQADSNNSRSSTLVDLALTTTSHRVSRASFSEQQESVIMSQLSQNVVILDRFLEANPVKYIWLTMTDYTGTKRVRMIPIAQFKHQVSSGKYTGITDCLSLFIHTDEGAPGRVATGEFKLAPDLSSLMLNKVISSPSATVQTWWMVDNGEQPPPNHHPSCPRWTLQRQVDILKNDYDISMLMGFEVEVIFVRPVAASEYAAGEDYELLKVVHHWSTMSDQQLDMLRIVEEIVETLAELGIEVPQFHAEAAPGQWEFPLPAFEPVKAVDVLYKARDVIRSIARKHGLRATLYPRPSDFAPASASHAHFSINSAGRGVEQYQDSFIAGILENLPSILAFSLPLDESYARIMPGIWAGSEYVAWGTQNRETPIRKCGTGHWELKAIDGIGNMYLTMAALTASGLHGLREALSLTLKDCPVDAATLSAHERADLGITKKLPKTLKESTGFLEVNKVLRQALGDNIVSDYIAVKATEAKFLNGMKEKERRAWLMSRY